MLLVLVFFSLHLSSSLPPLHIYIYIYKSSESQTIYKKAYWEASLLCISFLLLFQLSISKCEQKYTCWTHGYGFMSRNQRLNGVKGESVDQTIKREPCTKILWWWCIWTERHILLHCQVLKVKIFSQRRTSSIAQCIFFRILVSGEIH